MQAKKTLLAIALGTATLGASAYQTEYGNIYADVKVRYESNDSDNALDTATGLITDAAIGFESKDYEGFKALVEYEIVEPIIDDYNAFGSNPEYNVIADPETREWNRAQISYSKDGVGAVVGRQRIILDDSRFVGNVGWRANEVTFDAVTATYKKDGLSVFAGFIDQRNFLNGTDQDQSDLLLNVGYKIGTGKLSGFAYMLENDDSEATRDTYGVRYAGSSMAGDTKVIYSGSFATQTFESGSTEFDATYLALEAGAVVSGVTLALGNETLGSDDGNYGFTFDYGTNHKFNGWADKFLGTPAVGLSDTYVKAAGKAGGVKLVGFYHTFSAVEGSDDLGSELDLLAVKKLDDTFTVGAKAAFYTAGDTGVDTTKMWAWVQAKF
ncbi:hypothetical protein [Thalassolituus sp.]|uniref:hypothetical protein n=1 Tax=Thalassolituus sp. TaxID=2030822 RepID=UPI003516FDCF